MTKLLEIYKCSVCGNTVEILSGGVGELVCCDKKMQHLEEKTEGEDSATHKPILQVEDKEVTIRVGEIPHPMTEMHNIVFIEAISNDNQYLKRKYLKPDEVPALSFICNSIDMQVRSLCNLHGLWKK